MCNLTKGILSINKRYLIFHDMDELLCERKALIDAFYALNPDAYLQFLTIVPEIKDFPYWDPLQQIVPK